MGGWFIEPHGHAITIASEQGAKSLELRATTSVARLLDQSFDRAPTPPT
jgi:hypothetical protein